jgi:carbamoyl-phosphate synthase small subunit
MYRGEIPGYVVLSDGTVYRGFGFGAPGVVPGEAVFNTSMSGYQEVVTDPSYHGQLVTFTYPLIGNYGVGDHMLESAEVRSRGIIVREIKNTAWNQSTDGAWVDWLTQRGVTGVAGIDTRALTRRLRERGAMNACVATGADVRVDDLLAQVRDIPSMAGSDLVGAVTCAEPYEWTPEPGDGAVPAPRFRVVAFDYGIKRSILRRLAAVGCQVTVVPASWTPAQILALNPDGVFLSNGPGDPAAVGYAIENLKGLIGKVPIFGICLGHQLLSLAVGFSTYKLKFGHRGANHPVRDYLTGRVEITSQNHGFAVEPPEVVRRALERGAVVGEGGVAGLNADEMLLDSDFGRAQVTHLNLNDGTVEGFRLLEQPAYSVQYHPEAGPGPHDSRYLFDRFVELMGESR